MKYLISLLSVMLFASCANNEMSDENNVDISCDQFDTSGLKLYPFVPFTDEEWRAMSYAYKMERRQIPEDFLREMTTKELFYQVVYTDLSKDMFVFNTMQQGFEAVTERLNMFPELLNRPDAGHVLLEILQKIDPSKIDGQDCFWFNHCLQIILAQPEIINRMTDEDIDNYIQQQIRCHDVIRDLKSDYPASAALILFGLGNVMIRYEFEPFMQTLNRHPVTNELYWNTQCINEQHALQVINYIKQFKNR